MRARKTADIEKLRKDFNRLIERNTTVEGRAALCYAISGILMEANRYRGFQYTDGWKGVEDYRHVYY